MDIIKRINSILGELEEEMGLAGPTTSINVATYAQRLPFSQPVRRFMVKKGKRFVKVQDKRWGTADGE